MTQASFTDPMVTFRITAWAVTRLLEITSEGNGGSQKAVRLCKAGLSTHKNTLHIHRSTLSRVAKYAVGYKGSGGWQAVWRSIKKSADAQGIDYERPTIVIERP